ncbi:MAG: hypothetical protein V4850_11450 [Myxococcota bacterium]
MEGAVQVDAERIEWAGGVAVAEGAVEVRFGDEVLRGARATWDGTTLVVEDGVYRRPDGELAFDRAEVHPAVGTAVLVDSRVETGGAQITADRVEVGEGRWTASGATVLPCRCTDGAPPALSFRAKRVTVIPDRVVIVHGGVVRIFDVPLLPVPYWRVPLDPHRFRILVPEVGWGTFGPSALVEGRGGVGDWMFQGGPAWRMDRGARGELGITGPGMSARGTLGWDALTETVRGAGVTRGGVDRAARAAWDAAWVSDAAYLADYAVDYVSRGARWRDSRAVLGVGPSTFDVWLPDDGSAGTLARERVSWELGRGRSASVTPRVGIAAVGTLAEVAPLGEVGVGARATGGLRTASGTDWLAAEVRADVAGRGLWAEDGFDAGAAPRVGAADGWGDALASAPLGRWGAGGTGLGGVVATDVAVPLWSSLGESRTQWWPGVRAEARAGWAPGDIVDAGVRAGPALRATTSFAQGGIGLDAAVLQDGSGWRPAAAVDVSLEALALRIQAEPDVQAGEVRWMPGPVTLAVGSTHAVTAYTGTLWLGWSDAALALGRLRAGGGLAWDLAGGAYSGADARLGYDDGCTAAMVTARFAPDRDLPDFGFAATFRR